MDKDNGKRAGAALYREAVTIALLKDDVALRAFHDNLTDRERQLLAGQIKQNLSEITAAFERFKAALQESVDHIGAWALATKRSIEEAGYDFGESIDHVDPVSDDPAMGSDAGPS